MSVQEQDWLERFVTKKSWPERLNDWLNDSTRTARPFIGANYLAMFRGLKDTASGLRMVVNIAADALLEFLKSGSYANVYSSLKSHAT